MTKAEWIHRCAARMLALTGDEGAPTPLQVAEHLAAEQAEEHGASGLAWESPEAAAEREVDEAFEGEEPCS